MTGAALALDASPCEGEHCDVTHGRMNASGCMLQLGYNGAPLCGCMLAVQTRPATKQVVLPQHVAKMAVTQVHCGIL